MIHEIKALKIETLRKQLERKEEELEKCEFGDNLWSQLYLDTRSLDSEINKVEAARTLADLGLTFEEAVQILSDNAIPLILNEEDKAITEHSKDLNEIDDFVLIHETRYPPVNSKIKTPEEAGAILQINTFNLNGQEYSYEVPYHRNTVHFCMNSEVNTGHVFLDCDDCKYAIIIPLKDMPIDRMKGEAGDLYTVGEGPTLSSNTYILCPRGEAEQIKQNNPNGIVIEYDGESVRGYPSAFISTIGYKQVEMGAHSPLDGNISDQIIEFFKKANIEKTTHYYSKERDREGFYSNIDGLVALYNIIKDNGLIKNDDDFKSICENLANPKYRNPPIWEKYSSEQYMSIFIEKMKKAGILYFSEDNIEIDEYGRISFESLKEQLLKRIIRGCCK